MEGWSVGALEGYRHLLRESPSIQISFTMSTVRASRIGTHDVMVCISYGAPSWVNY